MPMLTFSDCVFVIPKRKRLIDALQFSDQSGLINTGWIPKRSATPSTALVPQRKVGFPIPNAGLLLGFQGTKTARREGISSPFSDAGGCTSPQNSGALFRMVVPGVVALVGLMGHEFC